MKAVVLLSGGLDSTVLLHKMLSYGDQVVALTLDYGQLHSKEIHFARIQAEKKDVDWVHQDISDVFRGIESPLLGADASSIPDKSYQEQLDEMGGRGTVKTYVPNRNMLLLAIAAAYAIGSGADTVAYAAHMDDAAGSAYPDCTPEFIQKMDAVLQTQGIKLFAPFVTGHDGRGWNKAEIVKRGLDLGVVFSQTWSCYKGGDRPCGTCGTCIDRNNAFHANGVIDPLLL